MIKLDEKIQKRMDQLERAMKNNAHIDEKLYVMELYYSVLKFRPKLNEEDRDFLQCVGYALETDSKWKV